MENSNEIGELLLSKGADVNAKTFHYSSILLIFLVKIIINSKRWFHKENDIPLHYAAMNNSKEIGELLISKGADINAKDIIY